MGGYWSNQHKTAYLGLQSCPCKLGAVTVVDDVDMAEVVHELGVRGLKFVQGTLLLLCVCVYPSQTRPVPLALAKPGASTDGGLAGIPFLLSPFLPAGAPVLEPVQEPQEQGNEYIQARLRI